MKLARISTRMARLPSQLQEQLINLGYAVCDAALRRHVDPSLPAPADFVYPAARV
jgi:NTE family protein